MEPATPNLINEIDREPFRPFTVRLSNDAQYQVHRRAEIGWSAKGTDLAYFAPQGHIVWIKADQVTAIIHH